MGAEINKKHAKPKPKIVPDIVIDGEEDDKGGNPAPSGELYDRIEDEEARGSSADEEQYLFSNSKQ